MFLSKSFGLLLAHATTVVLGAFQLVTTSSTYTVDTNGGLVFAVSR